MNNVDYVNVFAKNNSQEGPGQVLIHIRELKVNESATRILPNFNDGDGQGPVEAFHMPDHFTFTQKHGELPLSLQPLDLFGFVVKVKPNYRILSSPSYSIPPALLDSRVASWKVQSKIMVLWATEDVTTPIISYIPIEWQSQKHEDLLVSITGRSQFLQNS